MIRTRMLIAAALVAVSSGAGIAADDADVNESAAGSGAVSRTAGAAWPAERMSGARITAPAEVDPAEVAAAASALAAAGVRDESPVRELSRSGR